MILASAVFVLAAFAVAVHAATSNTGHSLAARDTTTIVQLGQTAFQCKSKDVKLDKSTNHKFVFPATLTTKTCGMGMDRAVAPFLNMRATCPNNRNTDYHLFDPAKVCQTCRKFDGKVCTPAPSSTIRKSLLKSKRQDDISNGGCELMDDGSFLCDYNAIDIWYLDESPISFNDIYFLADDINNNQTGQWEYYFFNTQSYINNISNYTTLAGAVQSRDCWCGNTSPDALGDPLTPASQCGFDFPCFTDLGCDLHCKPNYDGKTAMMVNFRRQTSSFLSLPGEDSYYWYWAEAKDDDLEAYDPQEFEKDAVVSPTSTPAATGAVPSKSSGSVMAAMSAAAVVLFSFMSV
ncbi:hypothetical protein HDU78_004428 [Chytriomyces hyalinus]|nr:hypothetical protein HDU78_004428 [Chytriomyces hyalinus]